jgi:hypothetical protein
LEGWRWRRLTDERAKADQKEKVKRRYPVHDNRHSSVRCP